MFVSFKEITWWVLERGTIKTFTATITGEECKIEASMMARFMATARREECRTERDEEVWKFTTSAGKASKTEG